MHIYSGLFFIAFSSLCLEISLVRILSVTSWYYLAFFAISTAMLGMTAGATRVYLYPNQYTPEKMAVECDIPADTIKRLAREFAKAAPKAVFDYGHRVTFTPQELELRRAIMMVNALVGAVEKEGGYYLGKSADFYNQFIGSDYLIS